mgnify:CR=1 FL=1
MVAELHLPNKQRSKDIIINDLSFVKKIQCHRDLHLYWSMYLLTIYHYNNLFITLRNFVTKFERSLYFNKYGHFDLSKQ